VAIGRIMFEAWHKHTLEARKQREYFEVNPAKSNFPSLFHAPFSLYFPASGVFFWVFFSLSERK